MTINPANPWGPVGILALAHKHRRRYRARLNLAFSGAEGFRIEELVALLSTWNGVVAAGGNVARMTSQERDEVKDAVDEALDELEVPPSAVGTTSMPAPLSTCRDPPVGKCLDCGVRLFVLLGGDVITYCDALCAERHVRDVAGRDAFADELKRRDP